MLRNMFQQCDHGSHCCATMTLVMRVPYLLNKTRETDRHGRAHKQLQQFRVYHIEFDRNRSGGLGALTCRWMDTANLTGGFIFLNAPKNES
jgi:hypothetical protein